MDRSFFSCTVWFLVAAFSACIEEMQENAWKTDIFEEEQTLLFYGRELCNYLQHPRLKQMRHTNFREQAIPFWHEESESKFMLS